VVTGTPDTVAYALTLKFAAESPLTPVVITVLDAAALTDGASVEANQFCVVAGLPMNVLVTELNPIQSTICFVPHFTR
jgi:hypothetical protein